MSFVLQVKPTEWELRHIGGLIAGQAYAETHGRLPDTPMWRILEFRHELNAARFAFWHPNVARLLERYAARETTCLSGMISSPLAPVDAPCIPILACDPPPPRTAALSTPEPASWVLLGVAMIAAYWRVTR